MMIKIEHVGIAVKDLAASIPLFEKLLQSECYKTETVENEKVITAFFRKQETKIELLQATSADSVIQKFIEKRGEGIHHIAFEVKDIYKEMERLQQDGFVVLYPEPKRGADNKLVSFLHPSGTNNLLIELCQEVEQ